MNFNGSVFSSSGASGFAGISMGGTITSHAITPAANNTYDIGTSAMVYNDVFAVNFQGRATSANWSDLAERYEADVMYEPGVVLAVGGEKEVTIYEKDMPYAGVVSEKPGLRMNDGTEQRENDLMIFVCLKGRIPVKIYGACKKGDFIIAYENGRGISYGRNFSAQKFIGIALSDSKDGIVEVKV